ncbi:MAG TPA: efflux RND transporter periplasmic adaptor subunit [Stellaceae bacterium]|nr:efflux RND transporter periplasmic adaptor subunit [Stellaceae bacterium]
MILGAGCAGGYELWNYYMFSPWTRDARVSADVVTIAPDVAGYVNDIRVKDNQFVHKGDILFVIDQERYKLSLETADAIAAARKAEMLMRQSEANRRAKLTDIAISVEGKEDARHIADAAAAAYEQAMADRSTAALNLDRTIVRAPVNGFVTNLTLVVGQYAAVGAKLLALIDSDSYRVEGYFEETKTPVIKPGDQVEIYLMSGEPALRGHVESISHGITDRDNPSGPELLANVTPTFEWVRLAQRIPTRIHIDKVPEDVRISAGMTCTVVVDAPPHEWAILSLIRGTLSSRAQATEAH